MRVLVACEFSGVVRDAFIARGHDAWSCDLLPSEGHNIHKHIQDDIRKVLRESTGYQIRYGFIVWPNYWDLLIAHPPCTRLANSGVRWLHKPPKGKTCDQMMEELIEAAKFYKALRDAPIYRKAIENPIMHKYAKHLIGDIDRQIVQPWQFGEPFFKATGFELHHLPPLKPTKVLEVPEKGTEEHKKWSKVHREPPGPERWKNRSRTFKGVAEAMADQWG